MNLNEWQANWDALGKDDPLWIVLTDPSRKGGRWDPKEFFATGEKEILNDLDYVQSLGISPGKSVALDFGCGVGRLSQALAQHFDTVHGVDISPSMIDQANRFNRFPGKVTYHINSSNRLEKFADTSVDFIYSTIALQHIEPRHSKVYLAEFTRVLKPGGVAVFQMISATFARKLFPQFLVTAFRKVKHRGKPYFGMYGVPERQIIGILQKGGAEIVDIRRDPFTWRWTSLRFCVRKL